MLVFTVEVATLNRSLLRDTFQAAYREGTGFPRRSRNATVTAVIGETTHTRAGVSVCVIQELVEPQIS